METFKITRKNCTYTHCYCEENIWKSCESLKDKVDLNEFHVVFISNAHKQIPLWCQNSGSSYLQPVVWDYHVILFHEKNSDVQVYDLDTTLDFPCSLNEYATKALRNEQNLRINFHRYFRVIPAGYFLKTFASDRSHMLNKEGKWLKSPPLYPPIKTQDTTMNLFEFIDMCTENGHGIIMDMTSLLQRFCCQVDWLETA